MNTLEISIIVISIIIIILIIILTILTIKQSNNKLLFSTFIKNFETFIGGTHVKQKKIKSKIDNQKYKVYGENFQESADTLAMISNVLYKFIYKLNYEDKTITGERKELAENLLKYFNNDNLKETNPNSDDTSYVENKGRDNGEISLCVDNQNFDNIIFVALHELSHIASPTYGHDDKFWQVFKFILSKAEEYGIYKPINYNKNNFLYCGKINVKYNPYFDDKITEL